jgi:3-carboxy-cis,cis-muconate cycloisomerase
MAGRTLLQQASVTTMGFKAAGWLNAIIEASEKLRWVRAQVLAVQFGGAVGTLAALNNQGLRVGSELAAILGLVNATMPWHTNRIRVAEVGSAVAMAGGVAGKIALDVALLSQTEVDEVREGPASGRGGSSALPQKRNAVSAVEILAAVRSMVAQAGVLMGSMLQEHERAAGAWQAEWRAMSELLLAAGGVASRLAAMLKTLDVDTERMRRNLDLTGGLIMSEAVTTMLAMHTDALTARKLVEAAIATARKSGRPFAEVLRADSEIARLASPADVTRALDPAEYLGESSVLIDAVLERFKAGRASKGER